MKRSTVTTCLTILALAAISMITPACAFATDKEEPAEEIEYVDTKEQEFIDSAGKSAKPSQEEYGVPASVTVAQAILESGWGGSKLSRESNNYFGMKCKDGKHGPFAVDCVKTKTRECNKKKCWNTKAWFRAYDSRSDSFSDHGSYLAANDRYDPAFEHTDDADAFIREIHKGGYATDPKYTDKIVALMKKHDLYRFNLEAAVIALRAARR